MLVNDCHPYKRQTFWQLVCSPFLSQRLKSFLQNLPCNWLCGVVEPLQNNSSEAHLSFAFFSSEESSNCIQLCHRNFQFYPQFFPFRCHWDQIPRQTIKPCIMQNEYIWWRQARYIGYRLLCNRVILWMRTIILLWKCTARIMLWLVVRNTQIT